MTLLAAKARAVGLVAGTALVTTALVGGGTVALTSVSNDAPLTSEASVVSAAATPTAGTDQRSATATAGMKPAKTPVPVVAFTCDPTKNHGQNVSAYGKTLAKGPGRGQQISAAAKSDCGKKEKAAEATSTKTPKPLKTKAAKPAKPAKAAKPAKPAKPAKAAKPAKPAAEGKGRSGKG